MGPRALIIWSAIAVASTTGAIYASVEANRAVTTAAALDAPVFDALVATPERASVIKITHRDETLTIEHRNGSWIVPASFDYAANEAAVRSLVTGLADLRYAAPRTQLEDRFGRLDVDTPGVGSEAKRVTVEAADGTILADGILGKQSEAITQTQRGTYLRLPDGDQAWLASGIVDVPTAIVDWLDTELPSIDRDALKLLEIEPVSGEAYAVGRLAAEDELTLTTQLPEERSADATAIRRLAGALSNLRFDDVQPAAAMAWPGAWTTVRGTTFDDEVLEIEVADIDGRVWVRFADLDAWLYRLPEFQTNRLTLVFDDLMAAPDAS